MKKADPKFLPAIKKTMSAYKLLITNTVKLKKIWRERYPHYKHCNFCKVMGVRSSFDTSNCIKCPLHPCGTDEMDDLDNALHTNKKAYILPAAIARRDWIIEKLEEAGYDMKKCKQRRKI